MGAASLGLTNPEKERQFYQRLISNLEKPWEVIRLFYVAKRGYGGAESTA